MRLVRTEGILHAQVTFQWEAEFLAEQGERWLPFCLVGHTEPIGEIHTATHEIQLYPGVVVADRQAVALSAPM